MDANRFKQLFVIMVWAHTGQDRLRNQWLTQPPQPLQQTSWVNLYPSEWAIWNYFVWPSPALFKKWYQILHSHHFSDHRQGPGRSNLILHFTQANWSVGKEDLFPHRCPTPAENLCLLFIQSGFRLKELHIQLQVHNHFRLCKPKCGIFWQVFLQSRGKKGIGLDWVVHKMWARVSWLQPKVA